MTTTPVEAVARAIERANTVNFEVVSFPNSNWHKEAQAAIDTLTTLGYLPPSAITAIERAALERAAVLEFSRNLPIMSSTVVDAELPKYGNATLSLVPSNSKWSEVSEGLECVAWNTEQRQDGFAIWIASTLDHDIMAQGNTYEEAKERLEIAINLETDGRKTGPSPAVKTFRIVPEKRLRTP